MRGDLEFEQPLGQERARDVRVSCIQSQIWNESSKICRFDIISTTKRPIKNSTSLVANIFRTLLLTRVKLRIQIKT